MNSEQIPVPRDLLERVLKRMVEDTIALESEFGVSDTINWGDEIDELATLLNAERWWL